MGKNTQSATSSDPDAVAAAMDSRHEHLRSQLHKEEKWQRQLLRDGEASDEESEEKVLVRTVRVRFGFTHEERVPKMEMIKKALF
ncbi:hypothetical protein ACFXTO_010962 [Malus domestica]